MKKIVLTSNTSWSLYNFRFGLMKALKEKVFHVIAVAPEDEYSEKLKEHFDFIALKHLDRKGKNPLKDFKLLVEYLSIYRRLKPALVINYTIKPNIYSSIVCRLLRIKTISVITGLGYVYVRRGWLEKIIDMLYKISLSGNEKIVFQNKEDYEEFLRKRIVPQDKAKYILGSGVDTGYFNSSICDELKKRDETFTFLMVSRLLWDKGVGEYVESARRIKEKFPQVRFWLLGPLDRGNPSAVPEEKLREWVEEGLVEYLGVAEDVRPFICKADCVVLPTYYREGLPRTILEAMAMEKPVITTDAPGCREAVIDGFNGFLVKPKDVESLFQAMERMLTLSPEERIKMGKRGRDLVLQKFDEKIVIAKYLEIIEKIV
jgi:glycosyltransferase involved in cell wall biosynthesis